MTREQIYLAGWSLGRGEGGSQGIFITWLQMLLDDKDPSHDKTVEAVRARIEEANRATVGTPQ